MPRPLPKNVASLAMGSGFLIDRPEMLAHFGIIAAIWAEIDTFLGLIIANILGAEAPIGIAMYVAIENEGSKLAMIRGLAESRLSSEHQAELGKLLIRVRRGRGERNDVIHGIWGFSNELPNDLIRLDPRDSLQHKAKEKASFAKGLGLWFPREKYTVYSIKDFEEIESHARHLRNATQSFSDKMLKSYGIPLISAALQCRTQ